MCASIVADVRLLSASTSWGLPFMDAHGQDAEAHDLADLVLCGTIGWIIDGDPNRAPGANWGERRAAYYSRLHDAHEAAGAPEGVPFNDPRPTAEETGAARTGGE